MKMVRRQDRWKPRGTMRWSRECFLIKPIKKNENGEGASGPRWKPRGTIHESLVYFLWCLQHNFFRMVRGKNLRIINEEECQVVDLFLIYTNVHHLVTLVVVTKPLQSVLNFSPPDSENPANLLNLEGARLVSYEAYFEFTSQAWHVWQSLRHIIYVLDERDTVPLHKSLPGGRGSVGY